MMWTPEPKQRLARIAALEPELWSSLGRFYAEAGTAQRLSIAREIVGFVFGA